MKINRWTFLVVVALVGAFFISNIKLTMSQTAPPTPTITQPANGANPPLPINIYWSGAVSPYYYTLWRNNTAVSGCIDVPYTTTQCMDTGANGTVSYTMVACTGPGASNNSSSSGPCMGSNAVSVTVGSPPPAPSSVTATLLSGKVSVTWPSSGAPKYSVWRSINGGTFQQLSAQIINTYFDDVSVTQGTAYQYWVFGCASDGFTCPLSPTVSNSVTYTGGANNAPPVPSTPTPTSYSGAIGAPYSYSTNLYPDPDGNQVKAVFDWGDGTTNESSLLTPYSGGISVTMAHIWNSSNIYTIKVKAVDSTGLYSSWSGAATMTIGNPPTAPVLTSAVANGSSVTMNWTENSTNVTGFKLYRRMTSPSVSIQALPDAGASVRTYTDYGFPNNTGLAAGTYEYYLQAYNLSGGGTYPIYSGASNIITVTISGGTSDTQAPTVPAGLAATATSPSQINLSWSPSTDNVGVVGYKIYRNGTFWYQTASLSFSDTGLTSNTTYGYAVFAYDAAGNRSASSTPLFLNTPAAAASSTATSTGSSLPAAPSSLAGSFAANGVDINFSWRNNADNALGFKISRRQIGGSWADAGSVPASSTSFINFAVPVGSWEYHVNACNMNGCSLDSNSVFFTVSSSANYSTSTMPGGYATSTIPYPTPYPSPQPTPTPIPAANAILSGTVFDGSGQAVSAAGIHIFTEDFNLNFGGATDTNGSFSFQIPSGSYKVEVYSAQSRNDLVKPAPLAVSVAAGETKRITIRFAANAKTVSGVASFSNGKPIIDAEVGAYSTDSHQWVSTFVDSSGRYALKVGGGRWQMGIRPRDAGIAKWSWHGAFPQAEFANDANAESQTVNFTIPVFDSNLIVHAVDESGNVLPEVGVIVDTTSPKDTGSQTDRLPPQFKKTGSDGVARFTLQSQTYFVRAVVASGKGYSNPEEVSVSLAPAEEKSLTLVFRKIQSVQTVALKGKARLERGLPIDAFIWSWSEKGGFMQTSANASGEFSLSLVANDRWHIGAGKKIGDFPYKSSEVIVDTGKEVASLEIVLSREGEDALPPAVTVTQAANQTVVAEAQDGARITLPPASVASAGNIKLEVNPTVEAPSQAAAKVVGTVYDIKVRDDKDKQVTQFSQDIEIILPYKDENLKAFKVKAEGLIPSYFDESTGSWVKLDNYTIDQERHVVIARVKHLTRFALVSAADTVPPAAPDKASVKRASSGLLVSWVNPTADFDHVKIYRSTEAGSLGTVLYNNIVSNSQLDSSTKTGTKYYYTVRAVDPAGNESVNVNQISGSGVARVAITFKRALKVGSRGDDVSLLQQILINEEVYPGGSVTGYFGQKTKEAVKKLQEKYKDDILTPAGLTAGNGTIGTGTRKKLNTLIP